MLPDVPPQAPSGSPGSRVRAAAFPEPRAAHRGLWPADVLPCLRARAVPGCPGGTSQARRRDRGGRAFRQGRGAQRVPGNGHRAVGRWNTGRDPG